MFIFVTEKETVSETERGERNIVYLCIVCVSVFVCVCVCVCIRENGFEMCVTDGRMVKKLRDGKKGK